MMKRGLLLLILGCFLLPMAAQTDTLTYQFPVIPDSLVTPDERSGYLMTHYWDNFEIENRVSLQQKGLVEQVFVDCFSLITIASRESVMQSIDTLLKRAGGDADILLMYADLADKYLYSGEGTFVSEEAYMPFVKAVLDSKKVDKFNKLRFASQYELMTQNQLGMMVTDFEYKLPNQTKKQRVKKLKSPYTLLYINDPDCDDCSITTLRLSVSQVLAQAIKRGELTVLSVYPDGESEEWLENRSGYPKEWIVASMENGDRYFDLRTLPVLYLLDEKKKIVLRQTTLEEIEAFFEKN